MGKILSYKNKNGLAYFTIKFDDGTCFVNFSTNKGLVIYKAFLLFGLFAIPTKNIFHSKNIYQLVDIFVKREKIENKLFGYNIEKNNLILDATKDFIENLNNIDEVLAKINQKKSKIDREHFEKSIKLLDNDEDSQVALINWLEESEQVLAGHAFPNKEHKIDFSKPENITILSTIGSGWTSGIFKLTASIIQFLKPNQGQFIIYDPLIIFPENTRNELPVKFIDQFEILEIEKMIQSAIKSRQHIFLMVLELNELINAGKFESFENILKKYSHQKGVHFVSVTNRPNIYKIVNLDDLLKLTDYLIAFNLIEKELFLYYFNENLQSKYEKQGDFIIFDKISHKKIPSINNIL